MSILNDTLQVLQDKAKVSSSCLVAFSGGKDSLVVLDLCRRTFKKVVCFHMFLVPGLNCIEEQMAYARERWKVEIVQYPHWNLFKFLKEGTYCNEGIHKEKLPDLSLHDVYIWAMKETGIPLLATGAKRADSMWRKRYFAATKSWEDDGLFYPIKTWTHRDVLGYMSAHKIPIPNSDSKTASGMDMTTSAMLWLHDNHPQDFKRVVKWFPYVEAMVWRRKFYGIGKDTKK